MPELAVILTNTFTGRWGWYGWRQPHPASRGRQHDITLVRKPDAGNPHVRFDERGVETERLTSRNRATPRVHPPSDADKPREYRQRFVMLDPRAIDKALLYHDSSGNKYWIGLLLETERGKDGKFAVTQAAPARMTKAGVRGKVVGSWKISKPPLGQKRKSRRSGPAET